MGGALNCVPEYFSDDNIRIRTWLLRTASTTRFLVVITPRGLCSLEILLALKALPLQLRHQVGGILLYSFGLEAVDSCESEM